MLKKKMIRDMKLNKSQFIAIFLMVFLGVFAYCGIRSYMGGMTESADKFYTECNLEDLTAIGENFTQEDLDTIKSIDNVKDAERKLTITATVESHEEKTMELSFIEANNISRFYIMDGEEFSKDKAGIWLDNFYAQENNLKVGDTISLKYDGVKITEKIVGLINVPDHVYDVKDEASLFPDHADFGFAYVSINEFPQEYIKKSVMAKMNITDEDMFNLAVPNFDYKDYIKYNYVLVDVNEESNKDQVKSDIENKVKSALAVTDIKDSSSYATYQGEIEEGETYVGVFAGLFLFIAILSVITTMTRVVKKQRVQIGTLKALGFKNRKITAHYVGYGFWISVLAGIVGFIAGPLLIGTMFIEMEMSYFEVPNGKAVIDDSSVIIVIIAVLVISLVTYLTCRSELKESPAETLREKMPTVKASKFTSKGIFQKMKFSNKWNLRDILRNKMRTLMGIVGITSCTMILTCAFGLRDTMNSFIDWQFEGLYNFDYKLSLKSDYTDDQFKKITDEYGTATSETLGIEIENGDKKEGNNAFVDDSDGYVRFTDGNRNYVDLKDDGIFVTRKLAENKGYKIGDTIRWHVYGDDTYHESKIVGLDSDPQNQNIKMTKKYLESLGIIYRPDSVYTNQNLKDVKDIDGVEVIQDKAVLRSGMNNMLNTMQTMIILLIVIAALLGIIIIYNLGVLSFSEKQYQFATLKVLGFKNKQIRKIYIRQNNWITIISIIIGLPAGYFLAAYIFKMAIAETYDMQAYINVISYIYALIGTAIVSWLSSHMLAKKVNKIDMVTSLKGNE